MKVKDLILELQEAHPEAEVILQKDSEGNGYSPLSGADVQCIYEPDTSYSGTVYDTSWTAEDAALDEDLWAEMLDTMPRCVVLFPLN